MLVYRIEDKEDHTVGPFNSRSTDPFLSSFLGGPPPGSAETLNPATAADVVAWVTGVPRPWDMPNGYNDGIEGDITEDYFYGFSSLDQYHEWFRTPLVRQALFKSGDMELRAFEVPEEKVMVGKHQVVFQMDAATKSHRLKKKEAID